MPAVPRPHILVTNDDGIYSEGIRKLAEACKAHGHVTIVAPDREQSAASHALTLNRPLRLLQIQEHEWIVDGTPSDCVNLAVLKLFKSARPDLIVSGINFGPNLGDDVTYSGTISAAFEGALLNIPSIAFSALVGENFSFDRCAEFAGELVRIALDRASRSGHHPQRELPRPRVRRSPHHPPRQACVQRRGDRAERPAGAQLLLDRRRAAGVAPR